MANLKTTQNRASVADFLASVADPHRREDAHAVCALMTDVTGTPPAMWGSNIVGFGIYHHRYASGRGGDWPAVGFSPRKRALTLYVAHHLDQYEDLLARLGPHTEGKSCLYLKRLSDVDEQVLRSLIRSGFDSMNGKTITS